MSLLSRRKFIKHSFLSSVILLTSGSKLLGATTPLQTIAVVQNDLFPATGFVPSGQYINANGYLRKILNHSRVSDVDKEFIKDGAKWLNEESVAKFKKPYEQLSKDQREKVLKIVVDTDWGESWISTIMNYLLEALLGDPIYGGNKGKIGWKWLNHKGGIPRPTKACL